MRILKISIAVILAFLCLAISPALAGFGDFLKGFEKVLGGGELTEEKIIQGLKEALEIGAKNAVENVSRSDGYFGNPQIRIPLPESVQKAKKLLRTVGYGRQVDAFELSMNRAAEKAAPEAKRLFWETIGKMSFEDAKKILGGRDNEATLYFKEKTWEDLSRTFKPIVHGAMAGVGVTRSYQDLEDKVRSLPFGDRFGLDLDRYVTDKALDGLFFMVAEEERKIRRDPAARVTELLREVFGKSN